MSSSKRSLGRPTKAKRNISGLRNQKPRSPAPSQPSEPSEPKYADRPVDESGDGIGLKGEEFEFGLADESGRQSKPDVDSDIEVEARGGVAAEFLEDELLPEHSPSQHGAHADEAEWVPHSQRQHRPKQERKTRGEYKKGPDVAAKSDRTQRRYQKSIAAQGKLQAGVDFVFVKRPRVRDPALGAADSSTVQMTSLSDGAGISG
ncbi:hypothetical protein C8R45DRAFT_1208861 [Mycena sanguinolenta]|nr:hypothetical protein C8R45DRAFT_1208861 [Mycena sanguinolenta]